MIVFAGLKLHSIDSNGEVNASVLVKGVNMKGEDVEYHEFIILDDWPKEYEKMAGDIFIKKIN